MARLSRAAAGLVLAAALGTPALAQQPGSNQPLRLAYINSAAILANTPGRAQAESLFAREMVGFRAEIQRLQQLLDSAQAEFTRTSVVMTPQARQTRLTEIQQMEQRTRQRAEELNQQAQAREQELTAPIMQRVTAVIEGIRAEFNYSFVFDVAAQGSPIITADRSLDISALVIQRLQAAGGAPPPAGATPAPGDTSRPVVPRPAPTRPLQRP